MSALLAGRPRVVNVGLEVFARELERLGAAHVHVDWRPPAGADPRLVSALARLLARTPEIDAANAEALERLVEGEPAHHFGGVMP